MPQILDPETMTVRQVTDQQFDAMLEARPAVLTEVVQERTTSRLWDNVDLCWTEVPVLNYKSYLLKLVAKCSACRESYMKRGFVAEHIRQTAERYERHQGAKVSFETRNNESVQVCSGCGEAFRSAKNAGGRHVEAMLAAGPTHKGATEVVIQRFSLAPSESTAPATSAAVEPSASQVEQKKRKRSRKRNRNRGGKA